MQLANNAGPGQLSISADLSGPSLSTYRINGTPQPLYNTIVGVQNINLVSYTTVLYPNQKKCIDYIEK